MLPAELSRPPRPCLHRKNKRRGADWVFGEHSTETEETVRDEQTCERYERQHE